MSNKEVSLYWHDYETFGVDPRKDRPAQFAGVRTDQDFNIISESLVQYCRPADDVLPHPEACLITGITPQKAANEGVAEALFIDRINNEMAVPGTCVLGYNTIRFDDEVTRNCLYRNFFDPYAREWQNGCSRWDIIDLIRITRALRPEGIHWPNKKDGAPSFRLEDITAANGIEHSGAHDALADVHATIAVAKRVKECQPKLYSYIFQNRRKQRVAAMLPVGAMEPVLHVSGRYSSRRNCIAVVVPLAQHPVNKNGVIVYDLSADPEPLLALSVEEIQQRIFVSKENLANGVERVPLKNIHLNKCPVIAPIKTLRSDDAERLSIDITTCWKNLERLKRANRLPEKVKEVFATPQFEKEVDPDLMLYSGGFFSDKDRTTMERIRRMSPKQLATTSFSFDDLRLPEMLFRYRARNYPESLNQEEQERWEIHRRERLTRPGCGGSIVLDEYRKLLNKLKEESAIDSVKKKILDELSEYGESLI